MANPQGIVDVGDELDADTRDELDSFFTDIGEAPPFALHGTGEETSMHGYMMHAMENPPAVDSNTPLTSLIRHHEYHQ